MGDFMKSSESNFMRPGALKLKDKKKKKAKKAKKEKKSKKEKRSKSDRRSSSPEADQWVEAGASTKTNSSWMGSEDDFFGSIG